MFGRLSLPVLTLLVLSRVGLARAAITTPYPGVEHRSESANGQPFHVVTVDLSRPALQLHVSAEAHRGKPLSEIARAEGAVIAINASFFRGGYSLCGVAVARGVPWKAVDPTTCIHGVAWPPLQLLTTSGGVQGPSFRDVVTGYPTLLRAGAEQEIPPAAPAPFREKNPRTMLGFDGSRAFLAVVDGRDAGKADGLTLPEAIAFMKTLGARDAVNLDGGGSTELWIEAEGGVQNVPSDGHERPLANAVVVTYDATREVTTGEKPRSNDTFEERGARSRERFMSMPLLVMVAVLVGGYFVATAVMRRRDQP